MTAGDLYLSLPALGFAGAAFGSFGNVVIHRVPRGNSVVKPRSSCPSCGRILTWIENLPLVSYLFLRAKCRGCGAKISIRYPMVEALTALLWVAVTLKIGIRPELPAFLAFVTTLVILSAIDLEHRRIPNAILGPAAAGALVMLAGAAIFSTSGGRFFQALIGAACFGVPMFALAVAAPAGMGMGDVKLAAYLGLHLGWLSLLHVAVGAFGGFFLGAVAGILLMAMGKKGRKETIPFGPSMAAGALVGLFWGTPLLKFWLG